MRNAKLIELNEHFMKIGLEGTQLFSLITPDKKKLIEETAKQCFHPSISVQYLEVGEKAGTTLKEHEDRVKQEEENKIKETARNDKLVQSVQKIFPGSKITAITFK